MKKTLIYGMLLFMCFSVYSCGIFGKRKSNKEGQGMEQEKKKKPKKCKLKSCHVRMTHMHEGAEFKGKRKWYLRPFFFCNREPKIGQGIKKDKRKAPQGK